MKHLLRFLIIFFVFGTNVSCDKEQPKLLVNPIELEFGNDISEININIENMGTGSLNWLVSETIDWLIIDEQNDCSWYYSYNQVPIKVFRSELKPGNYSGYINIKSNGGDLNVEATMVVDKISPEFGGLTDSRDGKTYKTVMINDKEWMAENLAYLPKVNYPTVRSYEDPCYYVYDFEGENVIEAQNTFNYKNYGALYNWKAALTACPANWHLPSEEEWTKLAKYISAQKGPYCKTSLGSWKGPGGWEDVGTHLKSNNGWINDGNGTDDFGFSGLPGGRCYSKFYNIGEVCYWWSSTSYENNVGSPYFFLQVNNNGFWEFSFPWDCAYSVRCIKD